MSQRQHLKTREVEDARRRTAPRAAVVYEAIRREGREEIERSAAALMWSGLAAGLSMGFSFLTEGLLSSFLPDAAWVPLISKLGYSVGFLIVILGRQQLFTENTLTPILHLLHRMDSGTLWKVLRLWGVVFLANTLGALLFALLAAFAPAFDSGLAQDLLEIGGKVFDKPFLSQLTGAVFAGWLIALTIWLLPFAETARVGVVIIITYIIGLGEFGHIIAGLVEAWYMLLVGGVIWEQFVLAFLLPVLLGNVIGGISFVAIVNYAQVASDSPNL